MTDKIKMETIIDAERREERNNNTVSFPFPINGPITSKPHQTAPKANPP
jgi:hypothetical protein